MRRKSTARQSWNKLLQQSLNKRRTKISLLGSSSKAVEGKIKTRKFILGWLHFRAEKGKYVMVRTPDGGGIRDVELPHDSTKEDIIDYATGMFFVGGSSKFGAAELLFGALWSTSVVKKYLTSPMQMALQRTSLWQDILKPPN